MAFDTFMYFTGAATATSGSITVKGETSDTTYSSKNAFEIYSFSFGMSNPVTIGSSTSGSGGGKVSVSSFNVMKKLDAASPLLMLACCQGAHFPQVDVVMRKAGGKALEYLTITFKEVYVESIQESGSSGGDDTPTESVSFAFKSFSLNYQPQDSTGAAKGGKVNAGWDVTTNAPPSS
jgi:type VI secretion system secreted protein Hcp